MTSNYDNTQMVKILSREHLMVLADTSFLMDSRFQEFMDNGFSEILKNYGKTIFITYSSLLELQKLSKGDDARKKHLAQQALLFLQKLLDQNLIIIAGKESDTTFNDSMLMQIYYRYINRMHILLVSADNDLNDDIIRHYTTDGAIKPMKTKTVRLLENMPIAPQQTLIIDFLLDFSGSMLTKVLYNKTRKDLLLEAFYTMQKEISNDRLLQRCCSFGVTKFNDSCQQIRPIATLAEDNSSPKLGDASGSTFLGEAVLHALACIETKKKELRKQTNILTPLLILISDGEANGGEIAYDKALELVRKKSLEGEINILPIAIGNSTGESLADFGNVLQVDDLDMGILFKAITSATKASIGTQSSNAFNDLVKSAISWSKI